MLCLVGALTGCHVFDPKGYRVTTQHTPLLSEAGQTKAQAALGANHIEVMGAISPLKHVGIVGSTYANDKGKTREFGIGGYHTWGYGFIAEGYLLYGESWYTDHKDVTKTDYPTTREAQVRYIDDLSFDYKKRGIQLNLGYMTKKVKFALGVNLQMVDYNHYTYRTQTWRKEDYLHQNFYLSSDITYSVDHSRFYVLSVAPTIQFTLKDFIIQNQLNLSGFIGNSSAIPIKDKFIRPAMFSTMIGLNIVPSNHRSPIKES